MMVSARRGRRARVSLFLASASSAMKVWQKRKEEIDMLTKIEADSIGDYHEHEVTAFLDVGGKSVGVWVRVDAKQAVYFKFDQAVNTTV
jgi:hypothetical protein